MVLKSNAEVLVFLCLFIPMVLTILRPASGETTGTDAGRCCLWIGIRWPRHGPRLQSQHLLDGGDGGDGPTARIFFRDCT